MPPGITGHVWAIYQHDPSIRKLLFDVVQLVCPLMTFDYFCGGYIAKKRDTWKKPTPSANPINHPNPTKRPRNPTTPTPQPGFLVSSTTTSPLSQSWRSFKPLREAFLGIIEWVFPFGATGTTKKGKKRGKGGIFFPFSFFFLFWLLCFRSKGPLGGSFSLFFSSTSFFYVPKREGCVALSFLFFKNGKVGSLGSVVLVQPYEGDGSFEEKTP